MSTVAASRTAVARHARVFLDRHASAILEQARVVGTFER